MMAGRNALKLPVGLFVMAIVAAVAAATPVLAAKRDNSIRVASYQVADIIDPYFKHLARHPDHRAADLGHPDLPRSHDQRVQGLARDFVETHRRQDARAGTASGRQVPHTAPASTPTTWSRPSLPRQAGEQGRPPRRDRLDRPCREGRPYRVRIVHQAGVPAAVELLASFIMIYPHEYYAKAGPLGMSEKPVGTGPFRVVEHARGKFIRMERNPITSGQPATAAEIAKLELRYPGSADPTR